jgi:hypothetical protein
VIATKAFMVKFNKPLWGNVVGLRSDASDGVAAVLDFVSRCRSTGSGDALLSRIRSAACRHASLIQIHNQPTNEPTNQTSQQHAEAPVISNSHEQLAPDCKLGDLSATQFSDFDSQLESGGVAWTMPDLGYSRFGVPRALSMSVAVHRQLRLTAVPMKNQIITNLFNSRFP